MWDLTVPGNNDHDFYVLPATASSSDTYHAGGTSTPILVHNTNPECSANFRSPNPDYPPNDAVMQAMQRQPINDCSFDCSEIADNLLKAAGGEGRIVSFKGAGDTLLVREGDSTVEYTNHQVYTDGQYAYDPRLSPNAIPWGDYMRMMKSLNPGLRWGRPGFAGPFS